MCMSATTDINENPELRPAVYICALLFQIPDAVWVFIKVLLGSPCIASMQSQGDPGISAIVAEVRNLSSIPDNAPLQNHLTYSLHKTWRYYARNPPSVQLTSICPVHS
jgi:hypothetical protein